MSGKAKAEDELVKAELSVAVCKQNRARPFINRIWRPSSQQHPPPDPSPQQLPQAGKRGTQSSPGQATRNNATQPFQAPRTRSRSPKAGPVPETFAEASRCSGWSPPACPLPAPCAPRSSGAGETAGMAFIAASGRSLRQGRGASRPWPAFWWWMRQNGGERHLASPVGGRAPLCRSVTQTTHGSGDERPSWMRGAFLPSPASPAGAPLARCRGHLRGTSQQAGAGPLGHRTQSTQEGAQRHPAPCSPDPWALGSTCLPPGGLPAKAWPRVGTQHRPRARGALSAWRSALSAPPPPAVTGPVACHAGLVQAAAAHLTSIGHSAPAAGSSSFSPH